jgi:hypothetical protein
MRFGIANWKVHQMRRHTGGDGQEKVQGMSKVSPTFEQVSAQHEMFKKEIPELLLTSAGKWVAYFNGVKTIVDTEEEALRWAYENLGASVPFVIAPVKEVEPVLLCAAMAFFQ